MGKNKYTFQNSLGYLVNSASRIIRKYLNQEFIKKGYSVTGEQFDILLHLWDTDGQHQQQLAEALYRDKTTITRAINSLEALNLVRRISNKKDKRQKLVYLSKSGEKIAKELTSLAQTILLKTQNGIDPAKLDISKNVLRQFNETLSKALI